LVGKCTIYFHGVHSLYFINWTLIFLRYENFMGLMTGVGIERELDKYDKKTKLNVILLKQMGKICKTQKIHTNNK